MKLLELTRGLSELISVSNCSVIIGGHVARPHHKAPNCTNRGTKRTGTKRVGIDTDTHSSQPSCSHTAHNENAKQCTHVHARRARPARPGPLSLKCPCVRKKRSPHICVTPMVGLWPSVSISDEFSSPARHTLVVVASF